jgi:hypothetical protein
MSVNQKTGATREYKVSLVVGKDWVGEREGRTGSVSETKEHDMAVEEEHHRYTGAFYQLHR